MVGRHVTLTTNHWIWREVKLERMTEQTKDELPILFLSVSASLTKEMHVKARVMLRTL